MSPKTSLTANKQGLAEGKGDRLELAEGPAKRPVEGMGRRDYGSISLADWTLQPSG